MSTERGVPSSPHYLLVTVGLAVFNAILLITAIVLGVYSTKVSPLHQNVTQLSSELKQLQANHRTVIQEEENIRKQIHEIEQKSQSRNQQTKLLRSANDVLDRQVNSLEEERTILQFNISALEGSCGLCLPGWDLHNSTCYYFASQSIPRRTWDESRAECRRHGADLVMIDSREKQMYITETLLAINYNSESLYGFHIGLREIHTWETFVLGTVGTWTWVDESTLSEGYWMDGEPNNDMYREDCAATYPNRNPMKSWNDVPCSYPLRLICEMAAKISV